MIALRATLAALAFTAAALACSGTASAFAQVPFQPKPLRAAPLKVEFDAVCDKSYTPAQPEDPALEAAPIQELNVRYQTGDAAAAQKAGMYLLDHARCAAAAGAKPGTGTARETLELAAYDYTSHYVWVTWIGIDAFDTSVLNRMLVHVPAPASYKLALPGISTIYEVFLGRSERATLRSTVSSVEQPDPLAAQIPAVAERIVPVLFGLLAATSGTVPLLKAGPPAAISFWVTPLRLDLPNRRALLTIKSVAAEPIAGDTLDDEVDAYILKNAFQPSACVNELVVADMGIVKNERPACATMKPQDCLAAIDAKLRSRLDLQLNKCTKSGEAGVLAAADEDVRTFTVASLGREVKADTTVVNAPLRNFSFSLVEAVALKARLKDPRVKLDDEGNLKADPLPRTMTLVTLNRSFRPYDPSTVSPQSAEKYRWFAGAVLTPDFGAAIGLSWMPVRGLSVNTGVAGLIVKSVPEAEIGGPANSTDPFRLGNAWAWFVGAGYVFK